VCRSYFPAQESSCHNNSGESADKNRNCHDSVAQDGDRNGYSLGDCLARHENGWENAPVDKSGVVSAFHAVVLALRLVASAFHAVVLALRLVVSAFHAVVLALRLVA